MNLHCHIRSISLWFTRVINWNFRIYSPQKQACMHFCIDYQRPSTIKASNFVFSSMISGFVTHIKAFIGGNGVWTRSSSVAGNVPSPRTACGVMAPRRLCSIPCPPRSWTPPYMYQPRSFPPLPHSQCTHEPWQQGEESSSVPWLVCYWWESSSSSAYGRRVQRSLMAEVPRLRTRRTVRR